MAVFYQVVRLRGAFPVATDNGICVTPEEAELYCKMKNREYPNLKFFIAELHVPDGCVKEVR